MLSEHEILSQHQASLRQAREACLALQINMVETRPRGGVYIDLRRELKKLEGSCRQMGHWRGDTRWLRLGALYAKAAEQASRIFAGQRWAGFGELAKLFELGLRRADALATRPTGRPGTLILPPQMVQ